MSDNDLIPILDLGPFLSDDDKAIEPLAQQLRWASENVGFYSIENHGIPQTLIDALFQEAARFHSMPMETKLSMRINKHQIGYLPMGASTLRAQGNSKYDLNEALFIRRERSPDDPNVLADIPWRGLNQWPPNLPGFRETVIRYMDRIETLGQRMLMLYAIALDMRPEFFRERFEDAHILLRMSHYPPGLAHDNDQYGIAPHTDSGFMTFLPQSRVPGLELRTVDHRWIAVPYRPGTYLVNTGDTLHRWTNGRFLSTLHRANNRTPVDRYAIGFFYDPNPFTIIQCLPTCCSEDKPPQYPTQTFAQYYSWFIRQNYPHQAVLAGDSDRDYISAAPY